LNRFGDAHVCAHTHTSRLNTDIATYLDAHTHTHMHAHTHAHTHTRTRTYTPHTHKQLPTDLGGKGGL